MYSIFYILNNRMEIERCVKMELKVKIQQLLAQFATIVKIHDSCGNSVPLNQFLT